ncbi:oligopeptide/dipeptide ABC transporter ATP-binding protein [Streptosporangium carneum]|uniref:Oligopeptide/dipeptide ABC transporter C-terminal domain-containing protein n=1 Tax=Streptosporangium carneum TaxID=47481 RepID=A0A9W6I1S3_9ACTN|nr:oligopeptide/dipeptide ABC transporter ATP-binding protein [Streptosporangium carneum]GLK09380.1 hypothetical protein GCM10017600_27860 [Streptosporangium carneum]
MATPEPTTQGFAPFGEWRTWYRVTGDLTAGRAAGGVADKAPLVVLHGDVPSPIDRPTGCSLRPRCPIAQERCRVERPALSRVGGRQVACRFPMRSPIGAEAGEHGRL